MVNRIGRICNLPNNIYQLLWKKKLDEVDIERARLVEIIKQKYIVKELKTKKIMKNYDPNTQENEVDDWTLNDMS